MEKLRDNSPSLSAKPSLCTSIHSKKPRDCVGPITRTYRQDTLLLQRKRQALNSKTEFLLIGLSKQLAKMHNSSFNTTHSAWNLGFIFSMNTSPFLTSAHLSPNPRCIRPYLDSKTAFTIATSIVHSKLHYCYYLYHNLPKSQITRLQQTQNSLMYVLLSKLPNPVTSLPSYTVSALVKDNLAHWIQAAFT